MNHNTLFDAIDKLSATYLQVWEEACNIESPTSCKAGVDATGNYLAARAERLGWEIDRFEHPVAGDALTFTMNPNAPRSPIVLSGHIDTVHPVGMFGSPAVRIEGDKIYGPGVADCKGGVVAAMLCMEALQSCGYTDRPVRLIVQSDEEGGSRLSNKETVAYMARMAQGCAAFLNTECGRPGFVTVERKGILRYRFTVRGMAAHSSLCMDGASAVAEAAHKILELEKWKDRDGISCNCGLIEGGTAANTVPEECIFVADIRYKTEAERQAVEKRVQEIANTSYVGKTTCSLVPFSHRVSMERNERNMKLFHRVSDIYDSVGLPHVEPRLSTGGSDAADMTAKGIPTLDNFGVFGGEIHSKNEYAYVSSLAQSAKLQGAVILYL